jgi:hypothetical protein
VVALDDVSVAVVAEAGKPVFVRVLATLEVVELEWCAEGCLNGLLQDDAVWDGAVDFWD